MFFTYGEEEEEERRQVYYEIRDSGFFIGAFYRRIIKFNIFNHFVGDFVYNI